MSATVVRELVAKLGLDVDSSSFKEADKGLKQVKDDLVGIDKQLGAESAKLGARNRQMAQNAQQESRTLRKQQREGGGMFGAAGGAAVRFLGGLAIGKAIGDMVELASSAQETDGLLTVVFGNAKESVKSWSDETADALGRSRYQLLETAGSFGALLKQSKQTEEQSAKMSEKLSVLAIDLASMFNTTEDEAVQALKSGIIGQSEPLLKYGINVQEVSLKEEAHAQGIKKKVEQMTNAEKTVLRYTAILKQGSIANGDAIRTAGGLANQTRALEARMRDLKTTIGTLLLPVALRLVSWGAQLVDAFQDATKHSNILEGALAGLAVVAAIVFGPFIASGLLAIAAIAAVALAVDDLITMFQGGKSLIGLGLDSLFGDGTAEKLVRNTKEALAELGTQLEKWQAQASKEDWRKAFKETGELVRDLGSIFEIVFGNIVLPLLRLYVKIVGTVLSVTGDLVGAIAKGFLRMRNTLADAASMSDKPSERFDALIEILRKRGWAPPTSDNPSLKASDLDSRITAPSAAPDAISAPASLGSFGANININQGGIYLTIPPGTAPDDAVKAARRTALLERRATFAALRVARTVG